MADADAAAREEAAKLEARSATLAGSPGGGAGTGVSPGADPAGGRFNFQADLFTGRFSYTVPIVVAPAR